jgi:hypothetical protein
VRLLHVAKLLLDLSPDLRLQGVLVRHPFHRGPHFFLRPPQLRSGSLQLPDGDHDGGR